MKVSRPGLTLVELFIAVLIAGVLARIALPSYTDLVYRARAASAVSDLEAVRLAAYSFNADTNRWPADRQPGQLPPELRPYLEEGFSFQRQHWYLDWENWVLPDGTPRHPDTGVLLGVSITTDDPLMGAALEKLVGESRLRYSLNRNYTFIIEAM